MTASKVTRAVARCPFPHYYRGMRSFGAVPGLVLLSAASLVRQLPRGLAIVGNSGENSEAVVDPQHRETLVKIATGKGCRPVKVRRVLPGLTRANSMVLCWPTTASILCVCSNTITCCIIKKIGTIDPNQGRHGRGSLRDR